MFTPIYVDRFRLAVRSSQVRGYPARSLAEQKEKGICLMKKTQIYPSNLVNAILCLICYS